MIPHILGKNRPAPLTGKAKKHATAGEEKGNNQDTPHFILGQLFRSKPCRIAG